MQDERARRAGLTRRDVMVGAGLSALTLTAGTGLADLPAVASGSVFEDRSGTGARRTGDPGIAGVLVSNGREVVRTDADGRWRLPVLDGDSLFVIKPPNWTPPLSASGIPRFSYLHQSNGPPPASIDFPLRRQPEHASFEALLLADPQPGNDTELAFFRDDIVAATLPIAAQFAIVHGDVVGDDLSLYPRYLRMLAATGIPWHHCPGNHDMDLDARDDRTSRETWKRVFGPRHYAFQYAGATFLMLDNVHYRGWNPGRPWSGTYCGRIGAEQLSFVRNVLAHVPSDQLIVLSMHIPLTTYNDPANPADNTADYRALLGLLSGRPHTVSFSGHMHTSEHHYLGAEHGFAGPDRHHHQVLAAASGSWWGGPRDCCGIPNAICPDGTPNGFHILSVAGPRRAKRFIPAAGKGSAQVRVLVDGPHRHRNALRASIDAGSLLGQPIEASALQDHALIVNVFDGGSETQVTLEVADSGRTEVAMQRADMADPYVAELIAAHPATFKSWIRAVPSSHVWRAPLPAGLPPGAHRVTVRARQPGGTQHVTHVVLEVAAPTGQSST
jgi:C terminal of Calcineurin-like phosphoesterase/Calcineurin-like phosphoesterase